MDFDFALLLVVLVAICGAITLLDVVWFSRKRVATVSVGGVEGKAGPGGSTEAEQTGQGVVPPWIEYPRSFFPVLLVVLLLRSFLVEPFQIPSGSMLPTLKVGDFILVNKFAYGLRLPVIRTNIWEIGEPVRGDIMVFKYPENMKVNYIKRVIGVPGDEIIYRDKAVTINGQPADYKVTAETFDVKFMEEDLGGVNHRMRINLDRSGPSGSWIVPEGHYFVMGDNRDNSLDSRSWGFVPSSHIVGKAFAIWMHKPGWIPSFSRNGSIE